jgi:hypothetical protein
MPGSTGQAPRFRDILLGVTALVILLVAFINLGAVVKFVGAGLLVIPSMLGITQVVGSQEISVYDLSTSPTLVGISQPGRYAVYAYDYDSLTISDQLEEAGATPWITLKSQVTRRAVPTSYVGRGLRLYDTYLAKGRPVLTFVITQPGIYLMYHPTRSATISVVRDYVTGKERILALSILAQIAVVVIPLAFLFTRRYLARLNARKAAQRKKRQESEAFWRDQVEGSHTWRRPR